MPSRFRSLGPSYYRGSDAAMLVFDVTNRSSFEHCSRWLDDLRVATDASRLTILLVGNKADLLTGEQRASAVSRDEAKRFVREHGLDGYAEVSALDGSVGGAFKLLMKLRLRTDNQSDKVQQGDGILLV